VDREQIVAAQRDALWVISLRAKLLRAQCGKQFEAAQLLAAQTRTAVMRATMLEQVHLAGNVGVRHRKIVLLVNARRRSARRSSALRELARAPGRTK
jgi:hypothetical protein